MGSNAVFAMVICEMHIPAARSLKEKRRVVKSFAERLRSRFNVSLAETDFQDLHQRAQLAMALVDTRFARLEEILDTIRRSADRFEDASVVRWDVELLEAEL